MSHVHTQFHANSLVYSPGKNQCNLHKYHIKSLLFNIDILQDFQKTVRHENQQADVGISVSEEYESRAIAEQR